MRRSREKILAELLKLLDRIRTSGDFSLALDPQAESDARELLELHVAPGGRVDPGDVTRIQIRHNVGWLHWYRHRALPSGRERDEERDRAVDAFSHCFLDLDEPADHPPSLLPDIADAAAAQLGWIQNLVGLRDRAVIQNSVVDMWRRVIALSRAPDPVQAGYRGNLYLALLARYENTGVAADLDEAIEVARSVAAMTPLERAADHADTLSNLGALLMERFEVIGSSRDLDVAVEVLRQAVAADPEGRNLGMRLSNLSGVLFHRSRRSGDAQDLDGAIQTAKMAVAATSEAERGRPLSVLGTALLGRYEWTGSTADLEEAIRAGRQAAENAAYTPNDQGIRLLTLSDMLLRHHQVTGAAADVDEAIESLRKAVETAQSRPMNRVADLPSLVLGLGRLGDALLARFELTGQDADRDAAIAAFAEAAASATGPPSHRIRAARSLAHLVAADPGRAADALETAVTLLPAVAPRRLHRGDQQFALASSAGLAGEAAALALEPSEGTVQERATRALRLLEAGRAVLLSQSLDTRDDLSHLRERHPDLADRFVQLRDQLDRTSDPSGASALLASPGRSAGPEDRHRLSAEFDAVLGQIRDIDDFASFSLPPTAQELIAEAASGPVVVFNVDPRRSDALLLTGTGITTIPLPGLGHSMLIDKINVFYEALHTAMFGESIRARIAGQYVVNQTLEWLWDVAAEPVLTAFGHHPRPFAPDEPPRVWWAPGGLLGRLPLHAAGHHADPPGDPRRRSVLDRVISSYTPTVRALHHARRRARGGPVPGRGLIVAMPTTPGRSGDDRLPHSTAEAAAVSRHLSERVLLVEPDPHEPGTRDSVALPTKEAVLWHLPGCAIAHFACHSAGDLADPSQSRLLLHDHDSDPLTVSSLNAVDLHRARLAYLSACRTSAVHALALADEAIHLTSAFQLAGFPHVIGTLWDVDDKVSAEVADRFYARLQAGEGLLDTDRAAGALHATVRSVRDRFPRTPSLWAAYLHAGA